jgi:hypothetical protein
VCPCTKCNAEYIFMNLACRSPLFSTSHRYETRPIPEPERELAKDNKIHTTSLSFLVDSSREKGHMMDQCHSMTVDVAHKPLLFQISF